MSLQFELGIKLFEKDAEDQFRKFIQAIALEALKRVVLKTPVDTGRARGNWNVAIGVKATLDGQVTEVTDKSGSQVISDGSADILNYPNNAFPVVVIFNNLPYIVRLEDGYSNQAPSGMVALTLQELSTAAL